MKSRNALLMKLLQTLVDEWGYEQVASALRKTSSVEGDPRQDANLLLKGQRTVTRLNATGQVERATIDQSKKEALLQLADRYDRHEFLPSVADVREFISMIGERPKSMKDRKEAFRVLLTKLEKLPLDRLQQLVQSTLHSGPSQLGPLSDAIAAAGMTLPRQKHPYGE